MYFTSLFYRDVLQKFYLFRSYNDKRDNAACVYITKLCRCITQHLASFLVPLKRDRRPDKAERLARFLTFKVPKHVTVIDGKFSSGVKDSGTNEELWKACFVVQRYRHCLQECLVHNIYIACHSSEKVNKSTLVIFGFFLFSTDLTPASL